jgi:hypothetical protein
MRKQVSSLQTFLLKIIFPTLWIPMFGMGSLTMFLNHPGASDASDKWVFLFAWLFGTAFVYWSCVRLKAVSVDDDHLYVSNYIKEIPIPLSEVSDVTENVWINVHPVTIHLRSPSEFG